MLLARFPVYGRSRFYTTGPARGWALAHLAAIEDYAVFAGDAINEDCAKEKRIDAHASLRRYYSWTFR